MLGEKLIMRLAELGGRFSVQFDPINRKPYGNHYGPTALAALEYLSHIYGVTFNRGELWWSAVAPAKSGQMDYTQAWFDKNVAIGEFGWPGVRLCQWQARLPMHLRCAHRDRRRREGLAYCWDRPLGSGCDTGCGRQNAQTEGQIERGLCDRKGIAARLPAAPFDAAMAIR